MASTKLKTVEDPTVHQGNKRFGLHDGPMRKGVGIECFSYAIHVAAHAEINVARLEQQYFDLHTSYFLHRYLQSVEIVSSTLMMRYSFLL